MGTRRRVARTAHAFAALLLTLGLALVPSAHAEGPGWSANVVVTKLVVTADGGVNIRVSPDLVGCVSNSGYGSNFASIYPSHPGIKRMKTDLLPAFYNGTTVALCFADNTCRVTELILGGY